MKIRINVDQAACLEKGMDAPKSTADIEVDPAKLSEPVRNYIAKNLADGIRLGLSISNANPKQSDLENLVSELLKKESALELKKKEFADKVRSVLTPNERKLFDEKRLGVDSLFKAYQVLFKPVIDKIIAIPGPLSFKPRILWMISEKYECLDMNDLTDTGDGWEYLRQINETDYPLKDRKELRGQSLFNDEWQPWIEAVESIRGVVVKNAMDINNPIMLLKFSETDEFEIAVEFEFARVKAR